MNKHTIKGEWNQLKGSVKKTWGELTDDDMTKIGGDRDKLVGSVQERYGHAQDEAERQVDDWQREHDK